MGYFDYLPFAPKIFSKSNSLPVNLIYFVTNKCNLRCSHCFFWKSLNKPEKELSVEEAEKFAKNFKDLLLLSLTGGEPFLRKDLPEIVRAFTKNVKVRNLDIVSNGYETITIVKQVEKILEYCPKTPFTLEFSIDAIGSLHDEIRGAKGAFKNVVKTFKECDKLRQKHKNLNLGVIITFSALNQDTALETYRWVRQELKPNSISVPFVRGRPKIPAVKDVDLGKFAEIIKEMEQDIAEGKCGGYNFAFSGLITALKLNIRKTVYRTIKESRAIVPCKAGYLHGVVYSNGDVYPCETLNCCFGNLRKANFNFGEIWSSKRAKQARKKIDAGCYCTHECFIETSLLFNPVAISRILCASLVTRLARALSFSKGRFSRAKL